MLPGDTHKIKPVVTQTDKDIYEYMDYLENTGAFSQRWLDIERAWAGQQAPGTVAHIVFCIRTIKDENGEE